MKLCVRGLFEVLIIFFLVISLAAGKTVSTGAENLFFSLLHFFSPWRLTNNTEQPSTFYLIYKFDIEEASKSWKGRGGGRGGGPVQRPFQVSSYGVAILVRMS